MIMMNENQAQSLLPQAQTFSPEGASALKTLRPTKKQKALLQFIEQFIAEHGYSPSYREIMTGMRYTSVATVALHVSNLIKRGHLRKRDHSARSIEVVSPVGITNALPTNQINEAQEKWLVDKVGKLFVDAEAGAIPSAGQIDDLTVVLAALQVIGLDAAAQSFRERLNALRGQLQK